MRLSFQGPSVCSALDSQESAGLASKDRVTTHDFILFEMITGMGCLALGFSGICAAGFLGLSHCSSSDSLRAGGGAGFPKTKWPPSSPAIEQGSLFVLAPKPWSEL